MHYNDPTVSCPGHTFVTILSVVLTIRRCPFTLLVERGNVSVKYIFQEQYSLTKPGLDPESCAVFIGPWRFSGWAIEFQYRFDPYTRNYRSVDNLLPCIKNEFYLTDLSWLPV